MVDRLYRGHLNTEEVKQIWSGSHKNVKLFLSTLQHYLKINFLSTLLQTNKLMSDIYHAKDYAASTMILEITQKSQVVTDQWSDLLARFSVVASFMNEVLKQDGTALTEMRATNDMFASIKKNIKFISTYPNMMILAYQLADSR